LTVNIPVVIPVEVVCADQQAVRGGDVGCAAETGAMFIHLITR
jgi:hypothetical protein